ncbi:MAG: tRNA pseudouridine(13) synthase TruD [Candidatus Aenigmarchaeota archaeon]|nr:tRNA pseudouridine(13) synthase TruD [Candidatus Aenigmarchaeota archaeon]
MKIKQLPEDFVVREVFEKQKPMEGRKTEDSPYIWFKLKKTNWDMFRALNMISRRLGVSIKRFGYAGTKDKAAVTYQRISVWNVPLEKLERVRIKDIELSEFEEKRERINLGDLKGNEFEIVVRDIDPEERGRTEKNLKRIKKDGVINLYGEQRFGIRGNTHLVGKEMLKNNMEEAVWIYLTHGEEINEESRTFRRNLKMTREFSLALRECPRHLRNERILLEHLSREPKDFAGALRRIPKGFRKMLVHAYQSYLWNEVAKATKEKVIPLVGFDTDLSKYKSGKEIGKILKKEGIRQDDFRMPSMPELASEGDERERIVEAKRMEWEFGDDDLNEGRVKCVLKFEIHKGAYATVVIDEAFR